MPPVGYIYSRQHCRAASKLPSNLNRSQIVFELHKSFVLLDSNGNDNSCFVVEPIAASKEDLETYHDPEYVDYLLKRPSPALPTSNRSQKSLVSNNSEDKEEEFGLVDDCFVFDGLSEYVQMVAGGSITAAKHLASGQFQHVIHWDGGRHHALSSCASGFCYVNDVVLAILSLRRPDNNNSVVFKRIVYLDIDVHHGDGVEAAFSYSPDICTVSVHRYDPSGFFPGTGAKSTPEQSIYNLPLSAGLSDETFKGVVADQFIMPIIHNFIPDAIVIVAGADGCAGDPINEWNLTELSFEYLAERIDEIGIPTLWLGGGGYNSVNCAKCWTAITAKLSGVSLPSDIPDTCKSFELYGPTFTRLIEPGLG